MIEELRIADLGVIAEASLALDPGLTVVTGETGAGKTMIINGLELLLGERADPRAVRGGAERSRVEGRFWLTDPSLAADVEELGGVVEDGELLVARSVTTTGRSRAYVGGAQVPVGVGAGLVRRLVTIHGQSEQARLADRARQRAVLDRFSGAEQAELLATYRARYAEVRAAEAETSRLRAEERERAREIDLLQFGLDEISRVAPQPGEDVALAAEAARLQSADDVAAAARAAGRHRCRRPTSGRPRGRGRLPADRGDRRCRALRQ